MEITSRGSNWHKWDLHVHTPVSGFATISDFPLLSS